MIEEEIGKKRKLENDICIEKKQRVEKLVSVLNKTDTNFEGTIAEKELSQIEIKREEDDSAVSSTETSELSCIDASRSRLYPDFKEGIKGLEKATSYTKREQPNKDSKGHLDPKVFSSYPKLPFAIMTSKAVGNSCHFRPRIIQRIEAPTSLQQQQQHNHCPYFPVPRGKGILINKKSPASSSDIIRVPRDNKTPFFIYTPPKYTLKPLPVKQPEAYNESLKLSPPSLKPISEVHSFACTRVSDTKPQESPVNTLADSSQDVTSTSERRKSTEQSTTKALSQWSVDEVYAYFQKTECATYATIFKDQEIDGSALLHLDELRISTLLGVKMGPAIKLYAIIKCMKQSA